MPDANAPVLFFGFVAHPNGAAVAVQDSREGRGVLPLQRGLLAPDTLLTAQEALETP